MRAENEVSPVRISDVNSAEERLKLKLESKIQAVSEVGSLTPLPRSGLNGIYSYLRIGMKNFPLPDRNRQRS